MGKFWALQSTCPDPKKWLATCLFKRERERERPHKKMKKTQCVLRGPLKIVETVNIYFTNYALLLHFLG